MTAPERTSGFGKLERPITHDKPNEIVLAFQANSVFDYSRTLREQWLDSLKLALNRGWNISQYIEIGHRSEPTTTMVNNLLELLAAPGPGVYTPRLALDATVFTPGFIIVPGNGAMLLLNETGTLFPDASFFYPPGPHLDVLISHYNLVRSGSRDLMTTFTSAPPTNLSFAFENELAVVEGLPGPRYVVWNGLPTTTVPSEVDEQRFEYIKAQGDMERTEQALKWLTMRGIRRDNFLDMLANGHDFFEIYPQSAIDRLVSRGIFAEDDPFLQLGAQPLKKEQRIHYIDELLKLLNDPHYKIALIGDRDMPTWLSRACFEVKDQRMVALQTLREQNGTLGIRNAAIWKPEMIAAFADYFRSELWEKLPDMNKDPNYTRNFLEVAKRSI